MQHDFHYISKHDPKVKDAYANVLNLLRELQNLVRDQFTFRFDVVGSYKRNMITYDAKSNIGFDFDFNIDVNDDLEMFEPEKIRKILQNALNKIAPKYGYDYPEASTRVLTIKIKDRLHSCILSSCDLAIVHNYEDDAGNRYQEYIRFHKKQNSYSWCQQPDGYYLLPEKIEWLKENDLWSELRDCYIEKKNKNQDPHTHSRTIFAQTVHELCQTYGFYTD